MRRRKSRIKITKRAKIIITIFSLFLCAVIAVGTYIYIELNKVQTVNISKTNTDLGITKEVEQQTEKKDIINIALFGIDSRNLNDDENSRSDSIMILSIDEIHNKIKLTSLMRDTYVKVDGHGSTKLTHAYYYDGPTLAIKTINQNFGMNIKDYATVNFFSLEKIIDKLGGVDINVKDYEISEINKQMVQVASIEHKPVPKLTKAGIQHLNGMQAVSYSRIRHVGNGDFERTERQRVVLEALFKKVSNCNILQYATLLDVILPNVETSLTRAKILSLGTKVLTSGIKTIEQLRLPEDGYCKDAKINKIYYLVADMPAARKQLYSFIYEDDKTQTTSDNSKNTSASNSTSDKSETESEKK